MTREAYFNGAAIVGIIGFIASWFYAVSAYGFFLGIGLGWIPAIVVGALVGFAWPVILGVVAIGAVLLLA